MEDFNTPEFAANCIRDAICGIWWSQGEDEAYAPGLVNAWASLNSALEALNQQPMNTDEEINAWRYRFERAA